jgi:dienelactone hydrolase
MEPSEGAADLPLLLVGHGGSGHKLDDLVTAVAAPLVAKGICRALLVDGPVHGARRSPDAQGTPLTDFDALWRSGVTRDEDAQADWLAALTELHTRNVRPAAFAYYGVSMGTAYGLPLLARLPKLRCAVLGMWSHKFVHSDHLEREARRFSQPLLFIARMQDTLFHWEEQQSLFSAFGSDSKHLIAAPGAHLPPDPAMLAIIHGFLAHHLEHS